MDKQKVLILNGSISEVPLIQEAKKLGYYVVTSGNAPTLIGHQYADEYIPADYSDKEAILEIVKKHGIDRIISCANDFGTITAAYVAEQMGWPGHDTYENTLLLHQKDLFKHFFVENGIRSPYSTPFHNKEEALNFVRSAEYPIIVKATDLTGGKGINRADNYEEAERAIEIAFDASRAKHIVIEPYVTGHQESFFGFIVNEKVVCSTACNCYSPINPYLIQTETFPSDYYAQLKDELTGIMEMICQKLHLADGVFTLQYIVKDGKPYIIELMRRCLGNQCLTVATAVTGFPWHEGLVRAEMGMECESLKAEAPMAKYAGHHGIMTSRNGKVKSVYIPDEIQKHVFQKIDLLQPGEVIEDHMKERVGYIYYKYDTREEITWAAEHFNDKIVVELED